LESVRCECPCTAVNAHVLQMVGHYGAHAQPSAKKQRSNAGCIYPTPALGCSVEQP
jgi:hypothetical protein